jgi:hypothetical protein
MATSGTYSFSSSAASGLTLVAFSRIGIRRTEITAQHLSDAATEANLLQVALGGNQPNLWRSEVYTISLVAGTSNYALPSRMIAVQDVYITTTSGGTSTDRVIFPMSLFEYDAQPNKTQQAPPTTYVVYKTLSPTITFWQTPDDAATYVANCRILSQMQDASQPSGVTLDLPYVYLDAYVAGLAYRMSRIYAPDKEQMRKMDWLEALAIAQKTDTQDNVMLYIQPNFSSYGR